MTDILSARELQARAMSEKALLEQVRALCRFYGLLTYHTNNSRRSEPGFPDLVIACGNGVMFRELKSERGRTSPEQRVWIDTLSLAGQDAGIWKPSDLLAGRIREELEGLL